MDATTTDYQTLQTLTPAQELAIVSLLAGNSDAEAAEDAGVHRVTVTRWRLYDPAFSAELDSQRAALRTAANDRLHAMLPKALAAIEQELENGKNKLRAALEVLKLISRQEPAAAPQDFDASESLSPQVQAVLDSLSPDEQRLVESALELLLERIQPSD